MVDCFCCQRSQSSRKRERRIRLYVYVTFTCVHEEFVSMIVSYIEKTSTQDDSFSLNVALPFSITPLIILILSGI